ncbi:MAG: hypothetical protein M3680_27645 [Myxococcota bacterium]|nr:hypothetical protein [Myxococcota bacterium]
MGALRCDDCTAKPVMRCGRCTVTRCEQHALSAGQRCDRCERDWTEEAPTRRNAKLIFAPPVAIFTGGLLFGLLPIAVGSLIGAAFMAALASVTALGTGAGACKVVDRTSRALFLRERAGGLPPARLLPAGRHR